MYADHPMDMWSVGCVVFELFTGKILFPGRTNNEMLKLMMDVKGAFPKKMLKRAAFSDKHFEDDANMSFALMEEDPVTKKPVSPTVPPLASISSPQLTSAMRSILPQLWLYFSAQMVQYATFCCLHILAIPARLEYKSALVGIDAQLLGLQGDKHQVYN